MSGAAATPFLASVPESAVGEWRLPQEQTVSTTIRPAVAVPVKPTGAPPDAQPAARAPDGTSVSVSVRRVESGKLLRFPTDHPEEPDPDIPSNFPFSAIQRIDLPGRRSHT
ncbi:hypothetical protein GCM10023196_022730 [Actinoallomurus vinaceus]|uniref:Uncharacterized protein n=1 Tax=Actinoallomurus vinaceus TaxID=1080074 RepID=A0ABP8U510_9ACTN